MYTISQRAKTVKQPRGGYLSPKVFQTNQFTDTHVISENENIPSGIISLCVNYMTRYLMGDSIENAFYSPMVAALYLKQILKAEKLLHSIHGMDNESIICACQLCGYDLSYRSGRKNFRSNTLIQPNEATIENIKIMIMRSILFFQSNGPVVQSGYTLEGGYSETIYSGNGDFMTDHTLWDMKILSKEITNKHTLKILMCYLMGLHSKKEEFFNINQIGIFNPRKNKSYIINSVLITEALQQKIEQQVICY